MVSVCPVHGLIDTVKMSMKVAQAEANRKMVETIDILC